MLGLPESGHPDTGPRGRTESAAKVLLGSRWQGTDPSGAEGIWTNSFWGIFRVRLPVRFAILASSGKNGQPFFWGCHLNLGSLPRLCLSDRPTRCRNQCYDARVFDTQWIFCWTKSWKRWMHYAQTSKNKLFFLEKKGLWRQSSTHFALVVAPVWIKKNK